MKKKEYLKNCYEVVHDKLSRLAVYLFNGVLFEYAPSQFEYGNYTDLIKKVKRMNDDIDAVEECLKTMYMELIE